MNYISLSPLDLVLAAALIIINGAVSIAFKLGLERTIAVSAVRMVVQLGLIGLVLKFIFDASSPLWTALFALVMLAASGYEVWSRQDRQFKSWQALSFGATLPFVIGLMTTMFALLTVIGPDPWYTPRFFLPILGMMIGNALAGVSLVLNQVTDNVSTERMAIEDQLALGATRFEATQDILRRALRTGMLPILTSMAASGLVTLPGMMTGQILAGIDPMEAAKYQVMIMFLVAGATGLSVFAGGIGAVLLLTDDRHRLRLDRLQDASSR